MENSNSDFNCVAFTTAVVQLPKKLIYFDSLSWTLSFTLKNMVVIFLFWMSILLLKYLQILLIHQALEQLFTEQSVVIIQRSHETSRKIGFIFTVGEKDMVVNCGRKYFLIKTVASQNNMSLFRIKCFKWELRNMVCFLVDGIFCPCFLLHFYRGQTLLFPN